MTPAMTWADNTPPATPKVRATYGHRTLILEWEPIADATPIYYNVYRIDTPGGSPKRLAHKLLTTSCRYSPALPVLMHSQYAVTAVDAYGNESELQPIGTPFSAAEAEKRIDDKVKKAFNCLSGKK